MVNRPDLPLRLAFRIEGEWWNAYMTDTDTMKRAVHLGAIRKTLAEAHPKLKNDFMDLMKRSFELVLRTLASAQVTGWETPVKAPEEERTKE
jgi:hypothetical protein